MSFLKFLTGLFPSKEKNADAISRWDRKMHLISKSLYIDIEYPVIMFCHVPWDFEIYTTPQELISSSISCHWGLDDYFSQEKDEFELVVDSKGRVFRIIHTHYHKETDVGFSYPSLYERTETIGFLKSKIIEGCYAKIFGWESEERIKIENTLELIRAMNSFYEIINCVKMSLTDL